MQPIPALEVGDAEGVKEVELAEESESTQPEEHPTDEDIPF